MRVLFAAFLFLLAYATPATAHNNSDSGANNVEQATPFIRLTTPVPGELPAAALRNTFAWQHPDGRSRNGLANRFLIGGGVCLGIGLPLFLSFLKYTRDDNNPYNDILATPAYLGAIITVTGIGLTIPGIILKSRNGGGRRRYNY